MIQDFLIDKEWEKLLYSKGYAPLNEDYWEKREHFRHSVSWHVPTQSLVNLLISLSPIVSVGAGFAYTESLVIKQGGDIIATDLTPGPENKWCRQGKAYTKVEKLEAAAAVSKYRNRNVFMAWPPYDDSMALRVAQRMSGGRFLIFVGEDYGGCTANDDFFHYLTKEFERLKEDVTIPSWDGICDNVSVYKKNKIKYIHI